MFKKDEPLRLRFFAISMLWDLQRGDTIQWLVENRNVKENYLDVFINCILTQIDDISDDIISSIFSDYKRIKDKRNIKQQLINDICKFFKNINNDLQDMPNDVKVILAQYTNNKDTLNIFLNDPNIIVCLTAASQLILWNDENPNALRVLKEYLAKVETSYQNKAEKELYQLYIWASLWSWEGRFKEVKMQNMPPQYKDYYKDVLSMLRKGNIESIPLQRILLYILRYFPNEEVTELLTEYLDKILNSKKWDSKKNILAFQTTESLGYHGSYELLKNKILNNKIKVIASNKNMMTKLGALIGINSASEDDEERMNFDKKIGDAMHIFKAFLHDEERLRLIFSFCVGKMTGVNSQILQLLFKPLFKLDPNDKRHINYISILLTSYASNNIDYLKILNKKNPDFWNDSSSAVQFLTALTYIHLATQRELFVQEEKDKVAKRNQKEEKEEKNKEAKKEKKEEYIIYSEEPKEAIDKFKMILNSKNQNLILGAANSYERIILSNCYKADSRYLYDLETLKLRLSFSLFKHLRYFNFIMKYKEEAEKKGYHLDLRHFKPKEIGFMNNHYGEDYNYGDINLPDWTPQMIGQFIDHAVQLNSKMLKKSQTPLYELFQIIYNYTQLYKGQDEINEKKLQNKENEQNDNKENVINELNDLLESLKKLKEKYSSDHDSVYDFWLAQMEHDRYILSPQKEYLDASIHYIDEFLYKYPWQLEANLEKRSLLILSKKYEEDLLQKKQDELKQIEAEEKARKEAEEKAKEENEESEEAKEENEESEKVKEKKKEIEDIKLKISSLNNKIKFYQDRINLIKTQKKYAYYK